MACGALRSMDPQLAAELLLGGIIVTMVRRFKAPSATDTLNPNELADTITDMWAHGLVSARSNAPMAEVDAHGDGSTRDAPGPGAPTAAPSSTSALDATTPTATTILMTTQGI